MPRFLRTTQNSRSQRKAWFQVLKELIRQRPEVVVCAVVEGVCQGFRPFIAIYLTGCLIDAVYAGEKAEQLIRYACIGIGTTFLLSVLEGIAVKFLNQNLEYMYERQNGPLSAKSMRMDYEYLEDAKVHNMRESVTGFWPRFGLLGCLGDTVYHFTDVVFTLIGAVWIIIPRLVDSAGSVSGFVGSFWCSFLFLVVIFLLTWMHVRVLGVYNNKLEQEYDKKTPLESRKKYYLDLYAKADSQKDIRMCRQRELIRAEMAEMIAGIDKINKRFTAILIRQTVSGESFFAIAVLLVYVFAVVYGYFGIISIGSVVSFAASIRRVADSMFTLGEVVNSIKYESAFTQKYVEFMSLNQRKHEGTIPMEKRRDNKFTVEFDHVSFRYPGSKEYVIRDLNLKFVVGEKLAIVGKNGSGKTTFIKLLCRLYDVTEGCIKVNGIDIRKYDYREYCDLFGVVFQDFAIFDFPLGESLANSVEVEEDRARDALERAGLGERLAELPDGLQTYIGKGYDESGVNFSGGEKQKLAIARAIYKDAPFVIMDEPTAALDPEAEAEVFAGFDRMVGKKTAIYISHRLASCRFCEDILVFDHGQVVQHGTHEELEQQEGLYRKLWNAQARYYA